MYAKAPTIPGISPPTISLSDTFEFIKFLKNEFMKVPTCAAATPITNCQCLNKDRAGQVSMIEDSQIYKSSKNSIVKQSSVI